MSSLRVEALRLYARYQSEIVEAYRLCPWAERARLEGSVSPSVVLADSSRPDALASDALTAIAELERNASLEVGLLIFPRVALDASAFDRFVSDLARADAARRELGTAPFALAAFHPDARADLSDPERLVPFIRRTPDPTIQLVRLDVLDRVREGFNEGTQFIDISVLMTLGLTAEDTLPLRERIARANLKTIQRVGVDELERRFADIRRDRDTAYARLGFERASCPST